MKEDPAELEELSITTEQAAEGRTKISVYFDKKLKRSVEMKITDAFLSALLVYIEKYIDTMLFCDGDGIRFEDYADQYKSFCLILNPVDMSYFNSYYAKDDVEHRGSANLYYIKGPEAKRPSHTGMSGTKKQITKALYGFIQSENPKMKSELIESLLDADLYAYYDRVM